MSFPTSRHTFFTQSASEQRWARGTRTDSAKTSVEVFPICGDFRQMPSWVEFNTMSRIRTFQLRLLAVRPAKCAKNLYPLQNPSGNLKIPHGSPEKQEDFSQDPSRIRSRVVMDRMKSRRDFLRIPPAFHRNPSCFSEKPSWIEVNVVRVLP